MIKLLHAADFHLDSAFSALPPEQSARRRQEQRLVLEQLAAAAEGCDLVLLSGDLFDSARIYRDTLDALKHFFAACGVPIFIAPGNHDYLAPGSPYLTEDWGDNVHIFSSREVTCVHLAHCDVYGAAFTTPEMPSLLDGFHVQNPDTVNVMVLHGDMQPNSPYAPMTQAQIACSGLDYLALGHVHSQESGTCGSTTYAYPGCLMGRGFDECGQKGALQAVVSKGHCETKFLPIHSRKYEILTVEAGEDSLTSICAALPKDTQEDCYRIILTGESDTPDVGALEQALEHLFFSLSVLDRTVPRQALWAACGEDTLRGQFLRILREQYDDADEDRRRIISRAVKLTIALMDGREVTI